MSQSLCEHVSFSASGRIYHQAPIDRIKCIDPRYRITLAQQIAAKYRDPDSRVIVSLVPPLTSPPHLDPLSAAPLLAVTGARPSPPQTPPRARPASQSRATSSSGSSPPSSSASWSSSSASSYSSSSSAGRRMRRR